MLKYTANYAYTNPNFVIQNLDTSMRNEELKPLLYVLKNILQRGFPTIMSKYLQEKIGKIHDLDSFEDRFIFALNKTPKWYSTIKGDDEKNYYPARDFLEKIIPQEFGSYSFVQSMIVPEIEINEITGVETKAFINQKVDFYIPQVKLVIEIDGQHHKINDRQRVNDYERDEHLRKHGVETIRITTKELKNNLYKDKINNILGRFSKYDKLLVHYKKTCDKIESDSISTEEYNTKLLPTAVIRFQILLLELLIHNHLTFDKEWNFNICNDENIESFALLAIEDLFIWLHHLYILKNKKDFVQPKVNINISNSKKYKYSSKSINIDFSLFQRYTDENEQNPQIIFVRTDYFDIIKEKNYFRVSTSDSINYHITDKDSDNLRFFLQNIFNKEDFRKGQLPIISNALNLNDTIGLLPTGGGKSLCYQLPCLLQPSINFVVCPIKSLMKDQSENLKRKDVLLTNTNYICGDQTPNEKRYIMDEFGKGHYLFIWISPERFQIPDFRNSIAAIVSNLSISYAVIDEVHCLSEWGHDFRTSYLNLAKTIDRFSQKDEYGEGKIKYIGLTATASVNVLKDIKIEFSRQKQKLEDDNIKSLLDYSRKELEFEVVDDGGNKKDILMGLLNSENIIKHSDKASIIFTPNVNGNVGCYQLSNYINQEYPEISSWYAGSCPTERGIPIMDSKTFSDHKNIIQEKFKSDEYRILCATKAFGMGIDKQNIYYTFHYGLPASVESLYQEAGRAGRWDKNQSENIDKKAKCYVLLSKELNKNIDFVNRLFNVNTTFSEINDIRNTIKWDGKDIFTQMFLFTQNAKDVKDEYIDTIKVIKAFFEENKTKNIYYREIRDKIGLNENSFEKVIYRLNLLGIVEDWTRNFIDVFTVKFNTLNENHIIDSISYYIKKYNPDCNILENINNINVSNVNSIIEKSIWFLLQWIFDNIVYQRKQSLKTLMDWCYNYEDSESFKKRIDSYFTFDDATFILQHIAENPTDYEKWFEFFYSNKKFITDQELSKFKDQLSRFLESYSSNAGLNFISGIIRLKLNEFNDTDGQPRFENAVEYIIKSDKIDQEEFYKKLLSFFKQEFSKEQQEVICMSLIKYYPNKTESLADEFNIPFLLNDALKLKIEEIRKINIRLYEQFSRF